MTARCFRSPTSLPREASRRRPPRLLHRLLRRQPALLPRRRYRLAGGARHRQRPGDVRRPTAGALSRLHPGGGPADGRALAGRPLAGRAAQEAGVPVVTGDTKVVETGQRGRHLHQHVRHRGDTARDRDFARRARPGDVVLINGPIAQHGIAIMSVREGLAFETTIESDSAPLHDLVAGVLAAPASRSTSCATPRAAAFPARSTRSRCRPRSASA